MHVFHRQEAVPTNSCILLGSSEEALGYPRGDIALGFCRGCGFVSNVAFDERLTEYSGRYEETQGFSGTFNAFHRGLAERLIERHGLRGKRILEIGCGKGEFLLLLAELGNNGGVGFDPGYREDRFSGKGAPGVEFVKDFYSEKYAGVEADFVCCKMTLEHIHQTAAFLTVVRRAIGDQPDVVVFFQIPEATRILRDCAFEDIYYEHCSYFTPGSIAGLFRRSGFEVLNIDTEYAGQYLTIEAKPSPDGPSQPLPQEDDLAALNAYVSDFPAKLAQKVGFWRRRVEDAAASKRKPVLWGSGSKAVSFLTTLGIDDQIEFVVDINPHRQGFFLPATGQKIVSPSALEGYRPDLVIVMNPVYKEEITRDLAAMGLEPEILTL
jgi:SAM-dependent methyltransferase